MSHLRPRTWGETWAAAWLPGGGACRRQGFWEPLGGTPGAGGRALCGLATRKVQFWLVLFLREKRGLLEFRVGRSASSPPQRPAPSLCGQMGRLVYRRVGHTGLVKVEIQGSGDTLAVKGGGALSPVRQSQSCRLCILLRVSPHLSGPYLPPSVWELQ